MESVFVTPDGLETQSHAKNATKIASAVRAQRIQIVQRAMQTQLSFLEREFATTDGLDIQVLANHATINA